MGRHVRPNPGDRHFVELAAVLARSERDLVYSRAIAPVADRAEIRARPSARGVEFIERWHARYLLLYAFALGAGAAGVLGLVYAAIDRSMTLAMIMLWPLGMAAVMGGYAHIKGGHVRTARLTGAGTVVWLDRYGDLEERGGRVEVFDVELRHGTRQLLHFRDACAVILWTPTESMTLFLSVAKDREDRVRAYVDSLPERWRPVVSKAGERRLLRCSGQREVM